MIILFGTRQVVRDDDRPAGGVTECPRCRQFVVFKPRRSRTFFHIFWLPLIPLGAGESVLECPKCQARFATV